eukprot:749859-Hanusia_phi.AAC.2
MEVQVVDVGIACGEQTFPLLLLSDQSTDVDVAGLIRDKSMMYQLFCPITQVLLFSSSAVETTAGAQTTLPRVQP